MVRHEKIHCVHGSFQGIPKRWSEGPSPWLTKKHRFVGWFLHSLISRKSTETVMTHHQVVNAWVPSLTISVPTHVHDSHWVYYACSLHIYTYIYTLGVGDSFKKPWLHDRCFFLEISTFSQMHSDYIFLRGHCGQYPWRSWLYIGVMDRYWDYKSMTCDDNIDWFSQDDQEIIRLMSRFKITLSCQRLVTPMQK